MKRGRVGGDVRKRFVGSQIDSLNLQRLHKALCLGVIV